MFFALTDISLNKNEMKNSPTMLTCYHCISLFFSYLARKSEIIRSTELLLEAISCNDFESYAYVYSTTNLES